MASALTNLRPVFSRRHRVTQTIIQATLLSGALDLSSALLFGAIDGKSPGRILRFVASGPFGESMLQGGVVAELLGAATHFVLMAIIAALFVGAASRIPQLRRAWLAAGAGYGLCVYAVMYWVVIPARFDAYPGAGLWDVGNALFSHIVCVGMPMAWVTRRRLGTKAGL